ncbi:peptide-methionine (R)-S-oxide reductase MsrB [Phenylobacterium sp.]|jgi:peptide-methionine (R)-S-oxide reductase|uniref:peptide-methionine (R)-S-oxide reductase MsrB n=1 Tax=Phenylobacterium sp. TaxID=1871053 RepID=UPI002E322EB3|nr:peptide-methionine (R)-S-oxide reductase MsrB [Phenylobacterium sp.]HEX3365826.1 peptide-methionine (R)-S-oxide reductase MsrB [Phenylobacterium sp.]
MSIQHLSRRGFLMATALAAAAPSLALAAEDPYANSPFRKINDAEWRVRLLPASYEVLRHEDTERPGSSPLLNEHRKGTFACLGCGLPIFKSEWKYESGTGWPSFYTAIPGALMKKTDLAIGVPRTEYHCAQCLGHQGHVFPDGPKPTGLRYCNNGVALKFIPA